MTMTPIPSASKCKKGNEIVMATISSFSQMVVGGGYGNHFPHKGVEIKLGQFKCKPCQMEKAWYEAL